MRGGRVGFWEKALMATALLLSTSALLPLLHARGGAADPTQGDAGAERLWLALYGIVVLLLILNKPSLHSVLTRNKALLSLVVIAVLSAAWSDDPALTARRSVALLLTTVFGIYLATRISARELGALVSWSLALVVGASALMATLKPSYGLDHVRGDAWRGLFLTKNELGRVATLTLAVWLLRAVTLRGHPAVALQICAVSTIVLMKSDSRTANVVVLLLLAFLLALPGLRAHYSIAIPSACLFVACAVLGGAWLYTRADAVLSSVGSDSTLTGRREIWDAVWQSIAARPLVGYGYDAFWRGFDGASAQVWAVIPSQPPHAHNGVLELWLDVGVVGVALLAAAVGVAFWRAVAEARRAWTFEALFPLLVLVLIALYNVTESTLMVRNSLFWILLVAISVQLTPQRRAAAEGVAYMQPISARAATEGV
jgi:exopolysaccharide production protein ExoQ